MALIKCKECGSEVSSKAKTCPKCGIRVAVKPRSYSRLIGVIFFGAVVYFAFSNPPSDAPGNGGTVDGYVHVRSHLWSGVKLYYGPSRNYVFEVVGGNDNYKNLSGVTMRGLKVRYPNGNEEWKDRNYIISGSNYWVKVDDPALQAERWQTLEN